MAKVFGLSPPKIEQPKVIQTAAATAPPTADDQRIRAERLKQMASLDRNAGPASNQLTQSRLGDYSQAATRTGAMPNSSIVSGNAAA